VKISQSFAYSRPNFILRKKTGFSELVKISTFRNVFGFFFHGEMYFGVCFITPYNNINKQTARKGRNFENAERPLKGATAP